MCKSRLRVHSDRIRGEARVYWGVGVLQLSHLILLCVKLDLESLQLSQVALEDRFHHGLRDRREVDLEGQVRQAGRTSGVHDLEDVPFCAYRRRGHGRRHSEVAAQHHSPRKTWILRRILVNVCGEVALRLRDLEVNLGHVPEKR